MGISKKKLTRLILFELAREKERLSDRWCISERIGTNFNNLKGVIFLEEFKNCVHPSIKNHITENKAQTWQNASEMTDEFFCTHKHIFSEEFHF